MRWYTFPKGTAGKVLRVNADGTAPDQDVTPHNLREEIGTEDLLFDPIRYHNNQHDPERLAQHIKHEWQRIYARLGYCGVYRENDKGEGYVFVTRYDNARVA